MSHDDRNRRQARTTSLEQAASTIFVLTALLPLLIFVWIIHLLNAMQDPRVQIGLALSLVISMLGFAILRTTMRRTSEVLQLLVRAEAQAPVRSPTTAVTPETADQPHEAAGDAEASPTPSASISALPPSSPSATAPHRAHPAHQPGTAPKAAKSVDVAPAIGSIQELRDAADAVIRRWRREAENLLGRPVVVSVADLEEPEYGVLVRVSEVGLVLDQDGQEFGVLWRLVTYVALDPMIAPAAQPIS